MQILYMNSSARHYCINTPYSVYKQIASSGIVNVSDNNFIDLQVAEPPMFLFPNGDWVIAFNIV